MSASQSDGANTPTRQGAYVIFPTKSRDDPGFPAESEGVRADAVADAAIPRPRCGASSTASANASISSTFPPGRVERRAKSSRASASLTAPTPLFAQARLNCAWVRTRGGAFGIRPLSRAASSGSRGSVSRGFSSGPSHTPSRRFGPNGAACGW